MSSSLQPMSTKEVVAAQTAATSINLVIVVVDNLVFGKNSKVEVVINVSSIGSLSGR